MDHVLPFGSRDYFFLLAILGFSRAMDFLSTWIATPHMVLEGNPIAKWMGWKWGAVVNLLLVIFLARWPLSAIIVSTASVLVAARNFQSAWLMRSMGEVAYGEWQSQRLAMSPLPIVIGCLLGNVALTALPGVALVLWGGDYLFPVGIGLGMLAYALAVAVFSLLAIGRIRRRLRRGPPGLDANHQP